MRRECPQRVVDQEDKFGNCRFTSWVEWLWENSVSMPRGDVWLFFFSFKMMVKHWMVCHKG